MPQERSTPRRPRSGRKAAAAQKTEGRREAFDAILHPERLRMVQAAAAARRPVTAADLGSALPDLPTATLYRHLERLARAGVLTVVDEVPVRGARQRSYALAAERASFGPDDVAGMDKADHARAFAAFCGALLQAFSRYLDESDVDLAKDGVGYHTHVVHLSDAELEELGAALRPFVEKGPGPERKARLLSTVLLPALDVPAEEEAL